jgi:hypothetical protein
MKAGNFHAGRANRSHIDLRISAMLDFVFEDPRLPAV